VLGRRRAGKTFLAEDLLRNMSVPIEHLIDGDDDGQGDFQKSLAEAVSDKAFEKKMVLFPHTSDQKFIETLEALSNGHVDVGIMKECTYPLSLPPRLRDRFDYTFIFPDTSQQFLRKTWESYADTVPTFSGFRTIMGNITGFQCIVIDRKKPGALPWGERVYYYQAPGAS
jgi:hypothetical protein